MAVCIWSMEDVRTGQMWIILKIKSVDALKDLM